MLAAGNQAVPEKGLRKPFQGRAAATGKDALSLLAGAYLVQQVEKTNSGAEKHTGNLGHPW